MSTKRKLCITIDVEALAPRAADRPLERLIWGESSQGPRGLSLIMDIADRHGVATTSFLDLAGTARYGEGLLDVGREILRRGHDLQLHLHPENFTREFFLARGLAPESGLRVATNIRSDELFRPCLDAVFDWYGKVSSEAPRALRNIGYSMTPQVLHAVGTRVPVSSTCNPAYPARCFCPIPDGEFRWPTGLREIPVSCASLQEGKPLMHYNFNTGFFLNGSIDVCVERHKRFLEAFYARCGEDCTAVFVMHSWSFFTKDENGHFATPIEDAPERFAAMLEGLSGEVSFVTMKELADIPDEEEAQTGQPAVISLSTPEEAAPETQPAVYACPLCGTAATEFQDLFGFSARQCPACRSLERQRVFWRLYLQGFFQDIFQPSARILHIAPSIPERYIFKELLHLPVTTADIRPHMKVDRHLNIANMPEVADQSFDVIIASYVLTCTRHAKEAIAEFARILSPGGVLLCHDPLVQGAATREYDSPDKWSAFYGEEALQKYDVGSFRKFGELDYASWFEPHFETSLHTLHDVPTDMAVTWLKGIRR